MNQNHSLKKFLPLIIILFTIISMTIAYQWWSQEWTSVSFMRNFMGFFFIIFGSFKIINLKMFAQAYAEYDLIAQRSHTYAVAYPFIELLLGVAYLLRLYPIITNTVTLLLMLISAAGVARALAKHELITCACLGMVFKLPMTYVTLAEDLLMGLMALVMLIWQ